MRLNSLIHWFLVVFLSCLPVCVDLRSLWAQETDTETIEAESEAKAESESARAADLREAINENLVVPHRDEEVAAEQVPAEQVPAEQAPVEQPADEGAVADEEEHWYNRFETVTDHVQTLPDRVPGLRGRGWIHFGRTEGEFAHFEGGTLDGESGFNFRSLRGGLIRQINDKTTVKLEIDATDGDSNWVDLWGRFGTRFGTFTVGNQRVAQTLVNQTSRLSRTFMEVPLPADAFGLGRRLGVGWDFHLYKIGTHLTAFGKDLNEDIGKFGYGARFYANPAKTRFSVFHLGLSAVREKMDRDAQFRAYPETRVTNIRLVDTGKYSEVDQQSIFGIEIAGAKDSWSLRGEYFVADWDRTNLTDTRFGGYYLQANWAITGESFPYAQGKFLRIRPENHYGAFELAIRYSALDLNDLDVRGGEERNTSLALNWYSPGNQLRIQSSVIHVDVEDNPGQRNSLVFQVRAQLHW